MYLFTHVNTYLNGYDEKKIEYKSCFAFLHSCSMIKIMQLTRQRKTNDIKCNN